MGARPCVTTFSTYAETVAASTNSNDLLSVRGFMGELSLVQTKPTPMTADAKNVLMLVQNLISPKYTRHITRRELVVRNREAARRS